MQVDDKTRGATARVPYVSAGGRSLGPERRTGPPGSGARWSRLSEGDRAGRPVSDAELALSFETRRRADRRPGQAALRWLADDEIVEEAVQQAFHEALMRRPHGRRCRWRG
jgi:hypothetical protein